MQHEMRVSAANKTGGTTLWRDSLQAGNGQEDLANADLRTHS